MWSPWNAANGRGKTLIVCCVLNMVVAVILAQSGSYMSVFSVAMSMFCGISSFASKNQYMSAQDINNTHDENL